MPIPNELLDVTRLGHLADILLGAAYADGTSHSDEVREIQTILIDLVGTETLPAEVVERMLAFDGGEYTPDASCSGLGPLDEKDKHALLKLIARVTDADHEHDWAEDAYIRSVAAAIDAPVEMLTDLTVSIAEEAEPPPVPAS